MSHWIFAKKTTLWGPSDLADLRAWYKADAITGLSDGDPVSTWSDSSGGGYDLTQTSTARPLYQTNTLNGLPVVEFDGTDDYLAASTAADWKFLHDTTGATVIAVWKAGTTADPGVLYTLLDTGGRSAGIGVLIAYDDRSGRNDQLSSQVSFGTSGQLVLLLSTADGEHPANTATIVASTTDPGNATVGNRAFFRINGGTQIGGNTSNKTASTSNPTAPLQVGAQDNLTSFLDGYVAEIVICDAVLSSTDREKVEGYLAHKWGLESNLPAGHPYKNVAPLA